MPNPVIWSLQHKRDTAANWTANNPVLLAGQFGVETDTNKIKIGTGANWNATSYFASGVVSVNAKNGVVVLTFSDVGADASGSAAAAEAAAKAYADSLVVGLWDDRGNYNASGNTYPSSGGSGTAGAIQKGDIWTVSVAGTLGGNAVTAGDTVRALTDAPGQTAGNWAIAENNIGYVPENSVNKDIDGTLAANSDTKYPSQKSVKTYADTKADKQSQLLTGGAITIGTYGGSGVNNDIRVAAATWYVLGFGNYSTAGNTDFLDIALSSAGNQRFIGLYGTTSNTITSVEGIEAPYADFPATPANTALIGYVLVGDGAIGTTPDLSGYLLKSSKANTATAQAGTDDTIYLTPYSGRWASLPKSSSISSSATPSINTDIIDCFSITALAAAITSFTTNLTGTPVNFQPLIIRIKDAGAAKAITWGTKFIAMGVSLPTSTIISKVLTVAFLYDSVLAKWGCVGVKQEA